MKATAQGFCEHCSPVRGPCIVCDRDRLCGEYEVFCPRSMRVVFVTRSRFRARVVAWLLRLDYAPRGWWYV
jgi:hypothetical protein